MNFYVLIFSIAICVWLCLINVQSERDWEWVGSKRVNTNSKPSSGSRSKGGQRSVPKKSKRKSYAQVAAIQSAPRTSWQQKLTQLCLSSTERVGEVDNCLEVYMNSFNLAFNNVINVEVS